MGSKVIFSVLFGDYDNLNPAPKFQGWDSVLFTDKELTNSKGWKVLVVKSENPKIDSRRYKLLSHIHLIEYDLVCYIDANMILTRTPPNQPIWFPHSQRRQVVQEASKLVQIGFDQKAITDHLNYQFSNGFKDKVGLFQNGFFVRSNRSEKMNRLMQLTFETCEKFTNRDQLSLPYAVEKLNYYPEGLQRKNILGNFVRLLPHKPKYSKIHVHHITAARSDKNFGKAVNELIEGLPNQDWICLRDIDTVPPYHEEFIKQCEELANNPQGFSLIGCMTNRLGLPWQLVPGMWNEWDMKKHREKAKELSVIKSIKTLKGLETVGGLMMLFPKSAWIKAGKFPEGAIQIRGKFVDYYFSQAVRKFGKLGISEGIYLFHAYRMDAIDTRTHIQHLK